MSRAEIGVVLVNFHSEGLIRRHLGPLQAAGFQVVVVDNSGTMPSAPGLQVVDAGGNVGFGTACNLGVAALDASVRRVCLHNPDVEIDPSGIRLLASRTPAGALAPALAVRGVARNAGYRYPTLAREIGLAFRAASRSAAPRPPGGQPPPRRQRRPRRPDGGPRFGSCALMVLDRGAFEAIGGFDESYFLYVEDLDLWHRLRRAGFTVGFDPSVVASHGGAAGSPMAVADRELLRWAGVQLFASKFSWSDWRRLRRVHRTALRRLPARRDLRQAAWGAWNDDCPPEEAVDRLRAAVTGPGWTDRHPQY